jgi:ribose transport system permease protein
MSGTDEAGTLRSAASSVDLRELTRRLPTATSAAVVLAVLFVIYATVHADPFSPFQVRNLVNTTATIAILAVGQTIIVISGGFDFSAVAILAFLNTFIVTQMGDSGLSMIGISLAALAIGTAAGFVNGLLVGVLRVQSIIATIATFFVWAGLALAVLERPGGSVAPAFSDALSRDAFGTIPNSGLVILVVAGMWLLLRRTRFALHLYGTGSNQQAAYASGIRVRRTLILTYAAAGWFYAIAALAFTGATASGDPRVSYVLLAEMFAAVVIGGTAFGGGRGGAIGSILGAFVLTLLAAVLFALGFSSYYTGIVFGLVLVLAVVPGAIGGDVRDYVKHVRTRRRASFVATEDGEPDGDTPSSAGEGR